MRAKSLLAFLCAGATHVGINVGVEHPGDELDGGRLVRVFFREFEAELKCAVLRARKGCESKAGAVCACGVAAHTSHAVSSGPKMTACHCMMSLSSGAPFTPSGGSDCILLKSRIKRRRAAVDMAAVGAAVEASRAPSLVDGFALGRQLYLSTPQRAN